jgi:hypothetical protein
MYKTPFPEASKAVKWANLQLAQRQKEAVGRYK